MKELFFYITEIIYSLCGLVAVSASIRGLQNKEKRIGTFMFWLVVGLLFILGAHIPPAFTGGLIVMLALITLTKNVKMGAFAEMPFELKKAMAEKHKNKIFIPALAIGLLSFLILQLKIGGVSAPPAVALGISSIIAIILAVILFNPKPNEVMEDTNKIVMQVGPSSLLPQLLTGLGKVFTIAGIGELISKLFTNIIPENNLFIAVMIYCLSMAVFTMIMGNGFAAFSVITTGVAAPFLLAHGASIPVVGALGMTAGFCGTLMTPMAANFNIVSAAVLEIKDTNKVIKVQTFLAIPLLITHIILMYLLAF
ncbi:5-oxoproline transporter, DUF979 family subunit [Oceanivirga salmonicida]|uniref:5-oxoproline transporter, DUF979 family subunit n=1 Tax=Oceanivirga salmonicida TaxID=1769291 RepID=UPI00082CAD15|nr:DUF979 family protein [Oceanivirga salmonicida]